MMHKQVEYWQCRDEGYYYLAVLELSVEAYQFLCLNRPGFECAFERPRVTEKYLIGLAPFLTASART